MPVNTTKYAFIKPTVSADRALWGGYLNANWDSLDNLLGGVTSLLNTKLTTPTLTTPTLTTPALTGGTSSGMTLTTGTFSGTGAGITALNATNLATGTVPTARLPTDIPVASIVGLDAVLTAKADVAHAHVTADITGLDTALAGKLASGANAVSATKLATTRAITLTGDVTGTLNFDGTAAVSMVTVVGDDSHNHTTTNIDGLDTALAGKAPTTHTHTTAQVTGLDTALAGKAASSHTHTTANVTGLDTALAAKADDATVFTAGNGLSGGGSIGIARTFTLGTPGAVTAASTNAVTATSHTHSIDAAAVGTLVGQLAAQSVGTTALLNLTSPGAVRTFGYAAAAAGLRWASSGSFGAALTAGTWELQGHVSNNSTNADLNTSVWLRVI
jgi:hypothetical protein